MIVRDATEDDIPQLMIWGQQFYAAAEVHRFAPFDATHIDQVFRGLMGDDDGKLVIAEIDDRRVGMAGAVVASMWCVPSLRMAQELFWWVAPEHRRSGAGFAIVRALEDWARSRKCTLLHMMAMDTSDGDGVGKAYAKYGLRPLERHWVKEI